MSRPSDPADLIADAEDFSPPIPATERLRLETLQGLGLLDTPEEPAFDLAVQMAKALTGAGMAVVSLVDAERQWFKARLGVDVAETPRSVAFCSYTILQDDLLWVEDARLDARFRHNPLVTGDPFIRFYAGAPLMVAGAAIGTLCVFDPSPRTYDAQVAEQLKQGAAALCRHIATRTDALAARSLLAHTTDAAIVVDHEGIIRLWAGGAEALFGWTPAEAVGETLDIILPPEMGDRHRAGFARYMAGADGRIFGQPIDLKAKRRNGEVFPMELTLAGWDRGGRREVGALIRDTTVRFEQQTRLAAALVDAQEAERTKSRFLATMSHELRTPLNGVLGLGHVLGASGMDARRRLLLDGIVKSGNDLERLVNNVVALSAEKAGGTAPPAPLAHVVRSAATPFVKAAQARDIEFNFDLAEASAEAITADADAIAEVLGALLDNAVKLTRSGSITLKVSPTQDQAFAISVEDTGPGFRIDDLERLVQPFEQGESGSTRSHDGAGLGLAVARKALSRIGSRLEVATAVGQGSRFGFAVPCQARSGSSRAA